MRFEKFYNEVKNLKGKGNNLIAYYVVVRIECIRPYEKTPLYGIINSVSKQGLEIFNKEGLMQSEEVIYEISPTIYITHDNIEYVQYKINKLIETITKQLHNASYIDVEVNTDIDKSYLSPLELVEDNTDLDKALYTIKEEINFKG